MQGILTNKDTDATRPLLDDDLRRAIDTLGASTAAIQNQKSILASQYESLNRCDQLDEDLGLGQDRDIARLHKKHKSGRQNIAAAVVLPHPGSITELC